MVAVTGGAGYIGSHTVVELLNAGHEVLVIDNFSNASPLVLERIKKISGKSFDFEEIDICDLGALEVVFQKYPITEVLHFAAYKSVGESVQEPLKYYQNNIIGLLNILLCCEKFQVNKLAFSSSCTVYGEPSVIKIDESSETHGKAASPYGNTKKIGEQIITDVAKKGELNSILLRYFNPIGSHESGWLGDEPKGIPNNLIPYLTKVVYGDLPYLNVFGGDYDTPDGTCIRDYIHVVDLAIAHVKAIEYLQNPNNKGLEAINIGTGKGCSVLEVIKTFEETTGLKVNYKITERRTGDVKAIYASPEKAKKVLNWQAKYDLKDMLASAWEYQKKIKTI